MAKNIEIRKDHVELKVDAKIYSKESVFAAGYIFLDRCYILLDKERNSIKVYLYPKKKADFKRIGLDFYNELLNYSHYFSQGKMNAKVLQNIMQRALFSAAPTLAGENQDREIKELIKELEREEENEQNEYSRKKQK